MSDIPTPRTDAYYEKWQESWSREPISLDLCRQLERELAEANRRACEYYLTDESVMVMDSPEAVREARKKAAKRMIDMERELAEAREQRDTLADKIEAIRPTLQLIPVSRDLLGALAVLKGGFND